MKYLTFLLVAGIFVACGEGKSDNKENNGADSASTPKTVAPEPEKISLERTNVKKEAVADFSKKIDNPLNDWKFRVQVFETPHRFKYLMTLEYEEMNEKDTLKIPNLGFEPKVEIRAGDEPYSCIIGFIDDKDQFREYKKVAGKTNNLKVTTLKRYGVTYK